MELEDLYFNKLLLNDDYPRALERSVDKSPTIAPCMTKGGY